MRERCDVMANRSDREQGQPTTCPRRQSLISRMGPCSRTPSGPAVSIDCIKRPDRRLHPTYANTSNFPLQRGSHPQRTSPSLAPKSGQKQTCPGLSKLKYGHHRRKWSRPYWAAPQPSEPIATSSVRQSLSWRGNAELRQSLQENRTAQVWIHPMVGIRLPQKN